MFEGVIFERVLLLISILLTVVLQYTPLLSFTVEPAKRHIMCCVCDPSVLTSTLLSLQRMDTTASSEPTSLYSFTDITLIFSSRNSGVGGRLFHSQPPPPPRPSTNGMGPRGFPFKIRSLEGSFTFVPPTCVGSRREHHTVLTSVMIKTTL